MLGNLIQRFCMHRVGSSFIATCHAVHFLSPVIFASDHRVASDLHLHPDIPVQDESAGFRQATAVVEGGGDGRAGPVQGCQNEEVGGGSEATEKPAGRGCGWAPTLPPRRQREPVMLQCTV